METSLKIFMLGARRCGKSSTLASMLSSLDTLDPNICICFSNESSKENLRKKQADMEKIFSDENIRKGLWMDDGETGDHEINTYSLDVKICDKFLIHVSCSDIPGEIIQNDMHTLLEVSKDSDIIIVAIDTPQLMENKQKGVLANYVNPITDFCQILVSCNKMRNKRIIFVPLKCEKYAHEGRICEVTQRVKTVYENLIYLWKRNAQSDGFVTPVLTLGDLEFDHFEDIKKVGSLAYYKYTGNKNYSPKYCEQPLLYAIDYALHRLAWTKKTSWYLRATKKATEVLKSIFS